MTGVGQDWGCGRSSAVNYIGGPYSKDYSTLGSILGSHYFGKLPYWVSLKPNQRPTMIMTTSRSGTVAIIPTFTAKTINTTIAIIAVIYGISMMTRSAYMYGYSYYDCHKSLLF